MTGRQTAGIVPVDAAHLADWLDEYGGQPGFELTYRDEGAERTLLLHDLSLIERTLNRPAAAPAVRCLPATPTAEAFSVAVDDIAMLHTASVPESAYLDGAETRSEEAVALARLAETNPDAVRVSSVLALLDRGDDAPRADALSALRRVAAERPGDCTPALPILRSLLAGGDLTAATDALATVRALAAEDAGDVAPFVEDLLPYVEAEESAVRREATACLSEVAAANPDDLLDAVPLLATRVEAGDAATPYAVYALNCIAKEHPATVKPAAGTLGALVTDPAAGDNVRLNATAALGRVVGEFPTVGVAIVDDVVELFDAENHMLRNNAIGLVGDVATVHTDVVEPHVGRIEALLTVEDTYTRINASATLARVAEDYPESVVGVSSTLVDLLADENELVRENACWALGHLRVSGATEALEQRVSEDDAADVRERAAWALSRIE